MPSSRVSNSKDLSRLWQAVVGRLEVAMNPAAFKTWLDGARVLRRDGDTLVVEARSSFVSEWLAANLLLMVDAAAAAVSGDDLRVEFVAPGRPSHRTANGRGATPPDERTPSAGTLIGTLNRAFTFDRYLPTTGNRIAVETCTTIVDDPERAVSPVAIYGPPGMGKTHLVHAVAAYAVGRGLSCACLTAEEFTNRYQRALRDGSVQAVHEQLRTVDVLLVDDIQGIAGKGRTTDELVYTIDAVTHSGGSVVVASETNPLQLDFPDRLITRLAAGLVTVLDPFDRDERRLFVERTARDLRTGLPTWCIDRLAAAAMPSVRFTLGGVHSAIALLRSGNLNEATLDTELMRQVVSQPIASMPVETVIDRILGHFESTFEEVRGRSRQGRIAEARALMTVALHRRGESFAAIGRRLDDRDRATIRDLHARGQRMIAAEPQLKAVASVG